MAGMSKIAKTLHEDAVAAKAEQARLKRALRARLAARGHYVAATRLERAIEAKRAAEEAGDGHER